MLKKHRPSTTKLMLLLTVASIFICLTIVYAGPSNVKVRYVSGDNVNLRSKPSLESKIVAVLKDNEKLYVSSYDSGWVKVKTEDGYSGWVHENYIKKGSSSNQISSRGTNATLKVRYINTGEVNLRETPSLTGYVITSLPKGEKVFAESYDSSGWISIYLEDGTYGWIHEKFISTDPPSSETLKVRYIIGSSVNIRSTPSLNGKIIATGTSGDKCYVSSYKDGWVKIKFSDGTSGWVHEKFVGTSTSETPGMKVRYIVGNYINLRSEPSLTSTIIGMAKNGEKVFVESYNETGWAYVAFEDGTKAWLNKDYISTTPLADGMKIRYVCGNGVNVRKSASLDSSIVTIASSGDKVFVEAYDDSGWAKVVMEGERTGWINEKFLTNNPDEQNSITASKIRYIQGNGVNLRKSASLDSSIITTLKNATEVYVESYDNTGWVLVSTTDGSSKGWVYKGYVGVDILPEIVVTPSYANVNNYTDSYANNYTDSYSNTTYDNYYETNDSYYETTSTASSAPPPSSGGGNGIIDDAYSYMGVPYVWGGTSPYGFDCSGFVQTVYAENGIPISRTADAQFEEGTYVSKDQLQPGDLVFFSTYTWGASHVGIYIGNDEFIHASSGAGSVVITDLNSDYYTSTYLGAKRF